jgi:PAS domain S-box-containing protein
MSDPSHIALNDCAIAFDTADQKFLFISPDVYSVLGYNVTDFYQNGGLLYEMIDPRQRDNIRAQVAKLPEGESLELNYQVITATGEVKWVYDKKTLIEGQSGHKILLSIIKETALEKLSHNEKFKIREQFLNSLIDSQTNFLIRFDAKGNYTFVNKQFLKALGYKKSDILGRHFSFTAIEEEFDLCEQTYQDCIANPGKVVHLTHKKRDKNGNLHDIDWEFISIANDKDIIYEIQGIGQDVTHKKSIEKEIKETAEKLEIFIESITDLFFIIDKEWKFVKVNAAFEKVNNKSRDEIIGHVIWDIFPGILATGFEDAYRKAATENVKVQFTEYFEPLNKWFNTTVYPSAEGLTVFVKDITDEKRTQEELTWTKNNLEALINNTEDQIWSIDRDNRFVYMNTAYRRKIADLTGREPKEGDFSYLHTGYSAEIIEQWNQYYGRALKGERYSIINESFDPTLQRVLSFEISFNPIYRIKSEITGVGCFARNITEQLETEKAIVDQNERLRNIASLTSHELRRPVASMLGLINIIDRNNFYNPDNKEVIEHLLTVGIEIDEVIRLIVDKTFTDDLSKNRYQSP